MKKIKKLILLGLFWMVSLGASAYYFESGGIYYNITSSTDLTCEVTYRSYYDYDYSGIVNIPASVTYNSKTYSVTSIGDRAFYGCSGLTSVTIPNSVTSIGGSAFESCSGMTSITIPNSVTSIGDYAFDNCSGLTSVTIPNSVTSIGKWAFYKCTGLTSITIPNSVTSIGDYAFRYCSGLTSIEIPNSVTSIGQWAFECCSGLTSIKVADGNTKYDSRNNCNAIIETSTNTLIQGFKTTIIPNSVTSIGEYAFHECSGLISIEIPNSVTSIGDHAFDGCSGLTSVTIGNSVTNIGEYAFNNCTSLPVENNIRYADWYLIEAVDKTLSTYTIKNGTKWIGWSAFAYCSGLTSIEIPNSVTSIGDYAFAYCSGLTSVTIPNSVTSIGEYAFWHCSGLTSIEIPNSVTSIGEDAFWHCSGLTSIEIPNSVTRIGDHAFSNCSGLTSVTIPNSVTSIGNGAFVGCSNVRTIIWNSNINPKCLTNVCKDNLKEVTIGNSVTSIGESAFNGCRGLKSVKVHWKRPLSVPAKVFDEVDKAKCTLYVPKGTEMLYWVAPVWSEFTNIVEYDEPEDVSYYITINGLEGGEIMQKVDIGMTYSYKFKPYEEWEINSVTFNGQDVTSQLHDGIYSTPAISGNSTLSVVYKKGASGVKSVAYDSNVKVFASSRAISIAGATAKSNVSIYSTDGKLLKSAHGNARFTMDNTGVYIVKVDNEVFKVSL